MSNLRKRQLYGQAFGLATGMVAGTFFLGTDSAQAQDAAKPAEPPKGWEASAAAGLTLTRGNTKTFLATVGFNASKKWQADQLIRGAGDELLLGAGYGFGKDSTPPGPERRTVDFISGFGQFNHLFTDRFYGGLRVDALHDQIADISYRIAISPMAGYYLIKEANTQLSVEAGPTLVEEKKGGRSHGYWAARAADRFEHKFSDTARVWQTAEYVPQVDDFGNYYVNAEIGVESALVKSLSLRVVLQDQYVNHPAPGRQSNDLKLIAGLAYKF